MPTSSPTLLVICPERDHNEIATILADGGYTDVAHADGSDDTVARFVELDPDVVVVYASLDHGDARALTSELRAHELLAKLILIGDTDGPVRNALDAADFAVDRFLARPLAAKALLFAVRTCLDAARRARQSAAASPTAPVSGKISTAMDQAIDEFVRTAMDALPAKGPPVPFSPTSSDAEVSAAPYPPSSTGPIPMITPKLAAARAAERRAKRARTPKRLSSTMVAVPPPPEAKPEGAQEAKPEAKPGANSERDGNAGPPRPPSGAFARQLRRKMSDMAARLFPSKEGTPAVDVGIARTHSSEIDLSSFGVDTVVERPEDAGALDQLQSSSPAVRTTEADREADEVSSLDFGETVESRVEPVLADEPADSVAEHPDDGPDDSDDADDDAALDPDADDADGFEQRGRTMVTSASDEIDPKGEIVRGQTDAAMLIERMYRQRFHGSLRFVSYAATKEIYFDRGRPVFATSDQAHDRMGEQLFREGKITSVQLGKVRDIVAKTGRRMGEVLIEKGWLKRRELLPVVRRHVEDLVYSLFAWEDGEYEIVEGDFAANERIRISRHPAAMILEGVRRKYEIDTLEDLLGPPESVIEIIDDRSLKSMMSVADLNSAERKVITSFDGERTFAQIHEASTLDLTEVYQLAYGLVVLGAAQSVRRGDDGPTAASDEPALLGETDLAIDRQRVTAKYSLVMEADYFTLLGVRRDATSFEVKRAYEAARQDFTGDGFPAEIRDQLGDRIEEISEVLEEAYLILRDDALRASYRANLRD